MARYTTTVETNWDPATAFRYLAEFSNVAEWDPGVSAARNLTDAPLQRGARFEVEVKTPFGSTPFTYETVELETLERVVLRAETGQFVSLDTLTFSANADGGTSVTYDADLTMRGPLKVFEPGLKLVFPRIADRARDGLADRLSRTPPAPARSAA